MTPIELVWAAGMFEGEGSIRINSATVRNNGALLVDMVNTDEEVIAFFQDHWPGYMRGPIFVTGNRKPYYRYRRAAWMAADFIVDILPYLRTERVRRKALLGLGYQAQKSVQATVNRTPEYAERQRLYFALMKNLNHRGQPLEALVGGGRS